MASARYTIRKGAQRKVQSYFDQSCGSIRPQLYSFGTRFYPSPCFGHIPSRCTLFWPPPIKKQVNFDPITDFKSILIPTLISGRIFFRCPDIKTQLISILTLKSKSFSNATQKPNQCRPTALKCSHFRPPTQLNQFHPCTDIKSNSIPRIEIKSIRTMHRKPSQFSCSY